MHYTVEEIASLCGKTFIGDGRVPVRYVYYDTRLIVDGREGLFVALRTSKNDGHRYVYEAVRKGISALLVERPFPEVQVPQIVVDDTLKGLAHWAAAHRGRLTGRMLVIGGTAGKTIVKEWIYQLVGGELGVVERSPMSWNSLLGVCLSLLKMSSAARWCVIEADIDHEGEAQLLNSLLRPACGIFTHLGAAHDARFSSRKEKAKEMMGLFEGCEWVLYPADERELAQMVKRREWVGWGRTHGDYRIVKETTAEGETVVELALPEGEQVELRVPFSDVVLVNDAVMAAIAVNKMGCPWDEIARRVRGLQAVPMRLRQATGTGDSIIVEDLYTADVESLEVALGYVRRLASRKKMPFVVVLGEMGEEDTVAHQRAFKLAQAAGAERVLTVGDRWLKLRYVNSLHHFSCVEELLGTAGRGLFEGRVVLLKGRRAQHLERVSQCLQLSSHGAQLEVNLSALKHNLDVYRSLLRSRSTGVIAVVKALAYGSGVAEPVHLLEEEGVDYFMVAYPDEGRLLREGGATRPIIVMNPFTINREHITRWALQPVVGSFHVLEHLVGMDVPVTIHIELDTGMRRLGFAREELSELCGRLRRLPSHVRVDTVFTHLVGADEPAMDKLTKKQVKEFLSAVAKLEKIIGTQVKKHVLSSAGVVRFPEFQMDLVRIGIGLHGVDPSGQIQSSLEPVDTLRALITRIHRVAQGEGVSYHHLWRAPKPTRVGVVNIGYADGVPERLHENGGQVYVLGRLVPVCGRVCMDMTMIDLGEVSAVEGDSVVFWGRELPLWRVAKQVGVSAYVLLSRVSSRIPRVYVYE